MLDPESDIMEHLEDHVYDEILELNTHILDTLPEEEIDHTQDMIQATRLESMNSSTHVLKNSTYISKYYFVLKWVKINYLCEDDNIAKQ